MSSFFLTTRNQISIFLKGGKKLTTTKKIQVNHFELVLNPPCAEPGARMFGERHLTGLSLQGVTCWLEELVFGILTGAGGGSSLSPGAPGRSPGVQCSPSPGSRTHVGLHFQPSVGVGTLRTCAHARRHALTRARGALRARPARTLPWELTGRAGRCRDCHSEEKTTLKSCRASEDRQQKADHTLQRALGRRRLPGGDSLASRG